MIKEILNVIYPNTCASCGKFTKSTFFICDECMSKLDVIDVPTCRKCGLPKDDCDCNRFHYRFKGVVSPFFYEDIAKNTMRGFKFRGYRVAGEFFAKYMVQFIKKRFDNIDFDAVVEVPMKTISRLERGYNQSEVLAKLVAKQLKVKHYRKAFIKIKNVKTQHDLNMEQRFGNIRGAFKLKNKNLFKDKTILLIDDIKTTGATLDECTRMLLLSGAKEVYCATGVITK